MKKIFLIMLAFIITVSVSSCYDSKEVDDMIYILAIGIDIGDGDNMEYTFQTAVPLNISSGIETGFASSEESATLQNIKVSAPNLFSAIDVANQRGTKELNISHCKLILLSMPLAEQGFETEIKSVIQNPDLRPTTLVAISDGSAGEYLDTISSPFELNPARYYDMVFEKDFSPQTFSANLYEFEKSDIVLIPLIDKNNQITTSVIKNFIQKGVLNNEETVALNMLTGNFKTGYLTFNPAMPAINLSQDAAPDINIDISDFPIITINLYFYGTPTESVDYINKFDNEIKKYIKNSCENLLNKSAKELNTDIIHIGKHTKMKFSNNREFNDFNWDEKYHNAEFNVNVEYKTIR